MYQLNRQRHGALSSTGRRLDLSPSGFALLLDRGHWRLLRPERGDGAGEVYPAAWFVLEDAPWKSLRHSHSLDDCSYIRMKTK
jgi:hypothetical protein